MVYEYHVLFIIHQHISGRFCDHHQGVMQYKQYTCSSTTCVIKTVRCYS